MAIFLCFGQSSSSMGIHLITSLWMELGNELRRYRVQLKLSCRVTVAALFRLRLRNSCNFLSPFGRC